MKACPWCQKPFDFGTFIFNFGSDSLIHHSPKAHPKEHKCTHCHKIFWIAYDAHVHQRLGKRFLMMGVLGSAVVSFILYEILKSQSVGEIFTVFLFLFVFSIFPTLAYAKYQSASFNAERDNK